MESADCWGVHDECKYRTSRKAARVLSLSLPAWAGSCDIRILPTTRKRSESRRPRRWPRPARRAAAPAIRQGSTMSDLSCTFGAEAKGNVITLRLGRSDIPFDRDVDDQAWTIRHPFRQNLCEGEKWSNLGERSLCPRRTENPCLRERQRERRGEGDEQSNSRRERLSQREDGRTAESEERDG